jgi:hypothetical protein
MKHCKVIEAYSSNLEGELNKWLARNTDASIVKMTQCHNPPGEANSMISSAGVSTIVLTIVYEKH